MITFQLHSLDIKEIGGGGSLNIGTAFNVHLDEREESRDKPVPVPVQMKTSGRPTVDLAERKCPDAGDR